MVQWLVDRAISQGAAAPERADAGQEGRMSREEHAQKMRDLQMKAGIMMRAPRRGWSLTDHQAHQGLQEGGHRFHAGLPQPDLQTTIPEHAILPSTAIARQQGSQVIRKPNIRPPRRSHSATDKEPEAVGQSHPQGRLTLLDLPSELHYSILDFLDPIDGVCFGLAHSRLYTIHRRKNGAVPLSSRYTGPNDREWAWRGAGTLIQQALVQHGADKQEKTGPTALTTPAAVAVETKSPALHSLRVKSQMYCRKCGTSRCELHRHLREWFGAGREYCEVKEMYGAPAGPQAKSYCYMPSPKNPHRCGRHGAKRSSLGN